MSWASHKQTVYFIGFLVILLLVVGIPTFLVVYDPPTCTDGIRNGMEDGIDCGGDCPKVCSFQAIDSVVHWSRIFEVIPGSYTVLTLVENPNAGYGALNVPYTIKLRDRENFLIAEEEGTVTLPPRKQIPIFLTGIRTGARVPVRADFEWQRKPVWQHAQLIEEPLLVSSREVQNASTTPRVLASLTNTGTAPIEDLPVIVILYDSDENALHTSRTLVETLSPLEEEPLVFTWPVPFSRPVSRIDIIPLFHEAQR